MDKIDFVFAVAVIGALISAIGIIGLVNQTSVMAEQTIQIAEDTQFIRSGACYYDRMSYCIYGCELAVGKNDAETQQACLNACKTAIAAMTEQTK